MKNKKLINIYQIIIILISSILIVISHNLKIDLYLKDIVIPFIIVLLSYLIILKNISINKLMRETNTDFKVLKRILTGELVRFDIFVVARLCDYLECEIKDIIEYVRK